MKSPKAPMSAYNFLKPWMNAAYQPWNTGYLLSSTNGICGPTGICNI